jgi:threonine/homoserine/homoserine lactone efflux protein
VNITNPKTALFFFAFLPQFVDPHQAVPAQIVVLGLTFLVLGLITDTAWGLVAGSAAGWVRGRSTVRSVQRWVTGCVFIGLGLVTAFAHTEKR